MLQIKELVRHERVPTVKLEKMGGKVYTKFGDNCMKQASKALWGI